MGTEKLKLLEYAKLKWLDMSDAGKVVSIEKGNGKIISRDGKRLTRVAPLQK